MGFINYPVPTPVFPVLPPLAWSVHKKPIMASRVVTSVTGREVQLACCVYPRWAFTLTYGGTSWLRDQTQNITPDPSLSGKTEFMQITQLFLACQGAYGEFYYDDPDDDSRLNEGVGIGDGTTTTFPLYYVWGNGPFSSLMTIPIGGINTIDAVYFNGTLQSSSSYTVDSTNTQLVFTSAPSAGTIITASYHFYFRCRFLDDTLKFMQFAQNKWDFKELRFESVKP